ncbi:MAG: AI-2E family transporter [Clostridia bacterium]
MVKKYAWLILFIALVALLVIYFKEGLEVIKFCLKVMRPIFMAVFFALVFSIPTRFLENKIFKFKRKKFRRPVAITTTYVSITLLTALVFYFLLPQLSESLQGFASNLPQYGQEVQGEIHKILGRLGISSEASQMVFDKLKSVVLEMANLLKTVVPQMFEMLKSTASAIFDTFFALILSVYLIADQERLINQLWRFIYAILPNKVSKLIKEASSISSTIFSQFLGGQLIEAIILGVLTFLGMLVLKLPYAVLVATVVMVSNIIPMLGAYIGGIVGFVIVSFVSFKKAVIYLIFMIILQQFENNVTYPKVVGNSLGLGGFWILSSALIGGGLFGFWGIMLGVPAVAVIYKMIGRAVGEKPTPAMLMPDVLKKSTQKTGDDCP